ncbi:N-acetylglucosamine-6-phosphate deacetylase [Hymenobacter aerilatus]|uniref:N-acetylglucosamine-6-phosphate deacetylase n=1 Tax=Hymenobacter aerilatus TaxID=2932251 RepID=A0A8T9STJ7_9BACT|nr:N-acetylglucosamine-6-phosphate deacetylase [Hymenobacter aerilatus]UOR04033.1 N-acetylglucosamine-6-phosphate deacetylase [Hymenobacter aerilatus]
MSYLLTNCIIYSGTTVLHDHAILIKGNHVAAIVPEVAAPADVDRVDGRGCNVSPGFIDLQIYGGGGALFSVDPTVESLQKLQAHVRRHGTTSFQATMPTNSMEMMRAALQAGRDYQQAGHPCLLGIHLEGPYINPLKKGAHQQEFIQQPTTDSVAELLALGEGTLRMMTLAPEVTTSEIVALLRRAEVVLSAGHSNATYAQGATAFKQGFTAATHLFNAMSALESRAPGLVGAIYDADSAHASIIADGVHCDFAAVRISHKMLGKRLFLITDAVEAGTHGAYRFRRAENCFVDENGTLAGSALSMMDAVRNCVQEVRLPLEEALRMATLYPAQVLALDDELGLIQPSYRADLCLFNADFEVQGTVLAGELAWNES